MYWFICSFPFAFSYFEYIFLIVFQDYFGVQRNSGQVYVKNQLDRETAEIIILEVLVTDKNAAPGKIQTATGGEYKINT